MRLSVPDLLDYLLHGPDAGLCVDLANPHTQDKLAIAQARANADLWIHAGTCRVVGNRVVEQRERKVAQMTRPARVIAWQREAVR